MVIRGAFRRHRVVVVALLVALSMLTLVVMRPSPSMRRRRAPTLAAATRTYRGSQGEASDVGGSDDAAVLPLAAMNVRSPALAATAALVRLAIARTQFDGDGSLACSRRRLLVVQYPRIGLASALGYIAAAYAHAVTRRRTLVFDDRAAWNYGGHWGYFFRPLSACTLDAALPADDVEWAREDAWPWVGDDAGGAGGEAGVVPAGWDAGGHVLRRQQRSGSWLTSLAASMRLHWRAKSGGGSGDGRPVAEAAVAAGERVMRMSADESAFFYHVYLHTTPLLAGVVAVLGQSEAGKVLQEHGVGFGDLDAHVPRDYPRTLFMAAVTHPNAAVEAAVQATFARPPPALPGGKGGLLPAFADLATQHYVSWHLRRGDKVAEGFRTYDAAATLPQLLAVVAATGVRRVFIASDDPDQSAAAASLLLARGLRPTYLIDSMPLGKSPGLEAAAVAARDPAAAAALVIDALANLRALSGGVGLTAIFHSNFARLAAELMFARGLVAAPFAWVDAAECDSLGLAHWSSGGVFGVDHYHPERDSYFGEGAGASYLAAAAAAASGATTAAASPAPTVATGGR